FELQNSECVPEILLRNDTVDDELAVGEGYFADDGQRIVGLRRINRHQYFVTRFERLSVHSYLNHRRRRIHLARPLSHLSASVLPVPKQQDVWVSRYELHDSTLQYHFFFIIKARHAVMRRGCSGKCRKQP